MSSCQKNLHFIDKEVKSIGIEPSIIFLPRIHWVQLADLPFHDLTPGDVPLGRVKLQGFNIGSKGFFCGGEAITSFTLVQEMKDLWMYDSATHSWTQKADCPGPYLDDAVNFVIGKSAYFVVGNQTWQYNASSNAWSQKASLPSTSRAHAAAFAVNGKGYVGFGHSLVNGADLSDFWEYDPVADSWLQKATFFGAAREGAMTFVIGGNGYVCLGGKVGGGTTTYPLDLWQYNPTTNVWAAKVNFPGAGRMNGVGLTCLGRGFVATGANNANILNDCWQYNATTNAWGALPNVGGGVRDYAGGFAMGHSLYVGGGIGYIGSDGMKDFWTLHLYN
jgi:N-acetylneuraminic acid mutarotase